MGYLLLLRVPEFKPDPYIDCACVGLHNKPIITMSAAASAAGWKDLLGVDVLATFDSNDVAQERLHSSKVPTP
jgi:hypothetical protein